MQGALGVPHGRSSGVAWWPPWHSCLLCTVPSHRQLSPAPFGDTDQIAQHSFVLMQSREISQLQAWMMPLTSWRGFRRADSSTVATAHTVTRAWFRLLHMFLPDEGNNFLVFFTFKSPLQLATCTGLSISKAVSGLLPHWILTGTPRR